jgi:hypothetical protein
LSGSEHNSDSITTEEYVIVEWNKIPVQIGLIIALIASIVLTPQRVVAQESEGVIVPEAPAWLEPRGVGIADLVGLVPESHLRDAIINYDSTTGMLQYIRGSRQGDTVNILAKVSHRYDEFGHTLTNCLGHRAVYDHWPITAPASEMRIYSNNQDITRTVRFFWYIPAGQVQPQDGAGAYLRYKDKTDSPPKFTANGALVVPANMGCIIFIPGRLTNLTAEFTIKVENKISVEVLGSETFNFHSYIGPGFAGQFNSIASQMHRYGSRHEKLFIHPPAGTEFLFVKFPPMDVSPSTVGDRAANARMPSSGTYRISAGTAGLSIDHQASMAIPLHGQFLDADLGGNRYLSRLNGINMIAAPEYFVPPGFPYDPCFQNGGCPSDLLDRMNAAQYPVTIYYYSIKRIKPGLTRIPLRQVGSGWQSGMTEGILEELEEYVPEVEEFEPEDSEAQTMTFPNQTYRIYLPTAFGAPPPPPPSVEPDDPNGCPCGWFDKDGRMLDFIPAN